MIGIRVPYVLDLLQHGLRAAGVLPAAVLDAGRAVLRLLFLGEGASQKPHLQAPDRSDKDPSGLRRGVIGNLGQAKVTQLTESRQINAQKEVPP